MRKKISKIAIIGFGNIGKAIFSGLVASGNFNKGDFLFSNSKDSNISVAEEADVIILAVRPEIFTDVIKDIKKCLTKEKLLISVVARTSIADIQYHLGFNCPTVRVMPNICAFVGESMSCWVKSNEVSTLQVRQTKTILQSIGEEVMLNDEKLFSAVTVVSGSGPAYFLLLAELFYDFSRDIGLESELSMKLIRQTFLGVAKMLSKSNKSARVLRDEIVSKGGTTEVVLDFLNREKFGKIFLRALEVGYKKNTSKNKS
ncbi:MAG: pyrroline-5-carboxylate reductase [Candidatus Gracilibacteria bacterium]